MHEIIPRISIDGISFSCCSQSLIAAGYVEDESRFDEITRWKTFKKDDDLEFYVDGDAIACVACFKNCRVNSASLIDQSTSELMQVLGLPDEIGDSVWVSNGRQQIPYEYFLLGLQVWFESDRVISVFCNAVY